MQEAAVIGWIMVCGWLGAGSRGPTARQGLKSAAPSDPSLFVSLFMFSHFVLCFFILFFSFTFLWHRASIAGGRGRAEAAQVTMRHSSPARDKGMQRPPGQSTGLHLARSCKPGRGAADPKTSRSSARTSQLAIQCYKTLCG